MSDAVWYVIHTKPRNETQVYRYLCSKDIPVFYPTLRVKPVNPRAAKVRPYFPRYLFVKINPEEVALSSLKWLPGAVGLVSFDGEAVTVQNHVMRDLEHRIQEVQTLTDRGLNGLRPGDRVRITRGPFAGYEAILDIRLNGEMRAQVLLEWLGRRLKVAVDVGLIEKVNT